MTSSRHWIVVLAAGIALAGSGCRRDREPGATGEQEQRTIPPVPSTAAERVPAESGKVVAEAALPMEGIVVSLDDASLVLRGGGDERQELAIDEGTRFVGRTGERVGRDAFQEGTRVQAHYARRGDELVLVEVRVATAER
jgi:hypothetical protein